MGQGYLYLVKMRVLTSSHPLVFGSLKRPFVRLPRFQDGYLLSEVKVVRLDDVHWALECPGEVDRHLNVTLQIMHDFLLSGKTGGLVRSCHRPKPIGSARFASLPPKCRLL